MGNEKREQLATSDIDTVSLSGMPNIRGTHPPAPLDTKQNIVENWKTFKKLWENYPIIMNINP